MGFPFLFLLSVSSSIVDGGPWFGLGFQQHRGLLLEEESRDSGRSSRAAQKPPDCSKNDEGPENNSNAVVSAVKLLRRLTRVYQSAIYSYAGAPGAMVRAKQKQNTEHTPKNKNLLPRRRVARRARRRRGRLARAVSETREDPERRSLANKRTRFRAFSSLFSACC